MVDVPEDNPVFQRIEWLDALNTDHAEIDDDHRRLIDDTNIILAVLAVERPWAELIELVLRMRANCVAHFRREEKILAQEDYPDIAGHAAEHRRIEQELAKVVDDLAEIPNPSPPARRAISLAGGGLALRFPKVTQPLLPGWDAIRISISPDQPQFSGRTIADIATDTGVDPFEQVDAPQQGRLSAATRSD